MPIISRIGRRHPKIRALMAAIYALLILGAATMVYPFLLMLAGSTGSGVDAGEFRPVPRFLLDEPALYRKHIEALFNESLVAMRETYDSDEASFDQVAPPERVRRALVAEWQDFTAQAGLPPQASSCGHMDAPVSRTIPGAQRRFRGAVAERFNGDIGAANRALGTQFSSWNWFFDATAGDRSLVLASDCLPRFIRPVESGFAREFDRFKAAQPPGNVYYLCVEGFYKNRWLKAQYGRDIEKYNEAHGTAFRSYAEIRLPRRRPPAGAPEARDWEAFARHALNLSWIRLDPAAAPLYRDYLRAKHGIVAILNRNHRAGWTSFEEVVFTGTPPSGGQALADWELFVAGWTDPDTGRSHQAPADHLRIWSVEWLFRDFLEKKYRAAGNMNLALGTAFNGFADVLPPQKEVHYLAFLEDRAGRRLEFATRNYRAVLDYLFFHGRGIANTAIYCGLAVLLALIVNPLAAYALSRYRMPSTYRVLLFLMLTMAFPPMVTQIPVFLMLREMKLLNTFAALLLPGLANGYAIFLLKGFFDSLPRELYESAEIDGADEWTMFWRITMSLSKPILSVIALQAFTVAYANFMFALLICQDQQMWTLMVWLYQLHQRSGQAVMYASLIVAAIPTFVIFAFCQKIIMRGIVIPVEK
ncbi:MAG: ABC transporter permease subunit [Verrucomicrobiota bacterium]|nr:ABC transporter permease subunit [Verrucomicrobiota bacterium]